MPFHFTIKDANIQDTLRYIVNFVNKYSRDPFSIQFANEFNPTGDKEQFIRRVFDYICTNGYYELDTEGEEEVWTPAKTVRTRNDKGKFKYDCKKISILLGSVLKAAGIEPVLKHIFYKNDGGENDGAGGFKTYTHIYIIVPFPDMENYLVVDPTNACMWNTEVPHEKAKLYFLNGEIKEVEPMNLHLMGNNNSKKIGLPVSPNVSLIDMFSDSAGRVENDMNAIMGCVPNITQYPNYRGGIPQERVGLSNSYFEYTAAEGIKHTAAVAVMAIPRAAFLGLLYLGKFLAKTPIKINLAYRLSLAWNKNPNNIRKWWWKNGGEKDASTLRKALVKTVGGTIAGPPGGQTSHDYPFLYRATGNSIGEPVTLATAGAALAAAAPLILGIKAIMKSLGVYKDGDTDPLPPLGDPEPPPPPPPPPGSQPPTAGSFNFIHDLTYGNPINAIIKSVIVCTAFKMHLPQIINFFNQLFQ